jgi:putative FmdB family regulatory protein
MPRYDYRCNDCGAVYEKREGFDAPAVQSCPECSGTARRVLTPPAIVFKGSGWYVNDSRKGSGDSDGAPSTTTKSNGASSDGDKTSSSSSSPSSDSSTTTKTESTTKS